MAIEPTDQPSTVVVVTGGDRPDPALVAALGLPGPGDRTVVAADSGVAHALDLGLGVDVAVGDFDSLAPAVLDRVRDAGATVDDHPAAKDATDIELALDTAVALGAERVVVIGGHGGRLDHFLANALVLAAPQWAAVAVDALGADGSIDLTYELSDVPAGRSTQVVLARHGNGTIVAATLNRGGLVVATP